MTEGEYETENVMRYDQKFLDKVRVWVFGGNGGTGSCAYDRENFSSKVPDGGNGGDGGNVFFRSSGRITSLHDLRRAHFKGNHGKHGKREKKDGQKGADKTFNVPLGTEIYEVQNSHRQGKGDVMRPEKKLKLIDLDEEGQKYMVAQGGKGSTGNFKKKNLFESIPGEIGEEKEYELKLKMIADVGFIGFPNAGKSTLLASITRAFPKIAPYPFTTLRPYVGLAKFVDESQIVFADLPGIIRGAHENKGLGH